MEKQHSAINLIISILTDYIDDKIVLNNNQNKENNIEILIYLIQILCDKIISRK